MNSNGVLRLYNSTLTNNNALNAIIYISACNSDNTIFDSTTFSSNGIISMSSLLA